MSQLFNDDDSESDLDLKTDTQFAKNYDVWRQKEELHKLQMKYGEEQSGTSSSSDDDSEIEDVSEKFDKDFFKTLSCLKNKDPRIYNKSFEFFENESVEKSTSVKEKKREKPLYVKDYERQILLKNEGRLSDGEESKSKIPTYVEEQRELKESLKNALKKVDDNVEEEDNWGGLFKARQKTSEEKTKDEEDYKTWLVGQTKHLKNETAEKELKPLKDYWSNPKLDDGEKFLRDYILKKKFLDSEETDYIPTYEEIIHDSDEGLSDDEEAINKQEEFEHKYNFRFEEPDHEFIKRYPRTMENSLRQKDNKRKNKRTERKERKLLEKQQKMNEIKQLKALKKKEIEEKIKKLKEITGNTDICFNVDDLEDDFDPKKHDERMQTLFDNEFYEGEEGDQKPEFPELDDELELENWDRWKKNEQSNEENNIVDQEPHCEDEDFNMDCDYDPSHVQRELIENTKRKKKHRRKSKFAKLVSQPKPVFDPKDKTYQEYIDEYYNLDCEDVIAGIPCRFKYREVVPNDFGLTVEEILLAKDKELNRWCSLKKAIQYRPDHVEKYDVIAFRKKGENINLKRKYLPSLFVEDETLDVTPSNSGNTSTNNVNEKQRNKSQIKEGNDSKSNNSWNVSDISKNDSKKTNERHDKKKIKRNSISNSDDVNTSVISNDIKDKSEISQQNKNKKKRKCVLVSQDDGTLNYMQNELEGTQKSIDESNNSATLEQNLNESLKKHTNGNYSKKMMKRKYTLSSNDIANNKKGLIIKKKKLTFKHLNSKTKNDDIGLSNARLAAYGLNPKKFKNKLKYQNK